MHTNQGRVVQPRHTHTLCTDRHAITPGPLTHHSRTLIPQPTHYTVYLLPGAKLLAGATPQPLPRAPHTAHTPPMQLTHQRTQLPSWLAAERQQLLHAAAAAHSSWQQPVAAAAAYKWTNWAENDASSPARCCC